MPIRLVVCTEVLSEGLNLPAASVIVHLDAPWTPAAVEQRVARAARSGNAAAVVHVYTIGPSRSAESLVRMARAHARKRAAATGALAEAEAWRTLRDHTRGWLGREFSRNQSAAVVLRAADGPTPGSGRRRALAYAMLDGAPVIIAVRYGARNRSHVHTDAVSVLKVAQAIESLRRQSHVIESPTSSDVVEIHRAIARWMRGQAASRLVSPERTLSTPRRRLLARLDALIRSAPAAARARVIQQACRVRALLAAHPGAGTDVVVSAMLSQPAGPEWLARVSERLTTAGHSCHTPRPDRSDMRPNAPEILALVVLPDEC